MGSAAGAVTGGSKGGGGSSGGGIGSITDAIKAAGGISAQFSEKAIASLNQYYQQATQQYGNYFNAANANLQNSNLQSQNILQGGFNQANQTLLSGQQQAGTYLAPYINQGLPALDAYSQSMGLGTPVGGSLQAFNQQQAAAQAQANANQAIGNQYNQDLSAYNQSQNDFQNKLNQFNLSQGANVTPTTKPNAAGTAASAGGGYVYDPATGMANRAAVAAQGGDKLDAALKSGINQLTSWNVNGNPTPLTRTSKAALLPNATSEQKIAALNELNFHMGNLDAGRASPIRGQISSAISGYKAPVEAGQQNIGMAPTAPNQANYIPAQTPIAAAPEMTSNAAAQQQGLQNFYASPLSQVLYGGNPQDMSTQSIEQRFQNDPGYQFQLQQGLNAVQNNALAKGQGYSPSMATSLQDYGSGLASQNFDTYRTGLANTFTQYQNQLQNLAGMGATASGGGATLAQQTSQGVNQNQTNLGTGQANINQATGQGLSNNYMNSASGQSNLSMAQGSNLANAYTGQGDTQSNLALAAGQAKASESQYQNASGAAGLAGLGGGLSSLTSLFGGSQGGGGFGGAAKGAGSGAAAGSMFGPWGTAIGAVGGGLLGAF